MFINHHMTGPNSVVISDPTLGGVRWNCHWAKRRELEDIGTEAYILSMGIPGS